MQTSPLRLTVIDGQDPVRLSTGSSKLPNIPTGDLETYYHEYVNDCEWRNLSPNTIETTSVMLRNLLWFLKDRQMPECGAAELRAFFTYAKNGHTDKRGRWGIATQKKPLSTRTQLDYFMRVRTFLRWMVDQDYIDRSPAEKLKPPIHRPDQIQPFSEEQFDYLLAAAAKTNYAQRDTLLVWMLYDLGLRSSEICGIKRVDLDMASKSVRVLGKGGKERTVYFGKMVAKLLWGWLRACSIEDEDYLFRLETGRNKGGPFTKDSLGALFDRLEAKAGIKGVRCSPHTMRHTSALEKLRGGARLDELQENLGHTSLDMTKRYVKLAQSDIARQSRYSPADRKKKRG